VRLSVSLSISTSVGLSNWSSRSLRHGHRYYLSIRIAHLPLDDTMIEAVSDDYRLTSSRRDREGRRVDWWHRPIRDRQQQWHPSVHRAFTGISEWLEINKEIKKIIMLLFSTSLKIVLWNKRELIIEHHFLSPNLKEINNVEESFGFFYKVKKYCHPTVSYSD